MSDKPAAKPSGAGKVTRLRPTRPCPICSKPSTQGFYPFCSSRCADLDLGRWLTGAYAIPARESEEDDAENRPETDDQDRDG